MPVRFRLDRLAAQSWNDSLIRNNARSVKGEKRCPAAGCFGFRAESDRLANSIGDHPRPGTRGANGSARGDYLPGIRELSSQQVRNQGKSQRHALHSRLKNIQGCCCDRKSMKSCPGFGSPTRATFSRNKWKEGQAVAIRRTPRQFGFDFHFVFKPERLMDPGESVSSVAERSAHNETLPIEPVAPKLVWDVYAIRFP